MSEQRERSLVWLIIPFFGGVVGGILTYLAFRHDDKKLAERCMYLGLGTTALGILVVALTIQGFVGMWDEDKWHESDEYRFDRHLYPKDASISAAMHAMYLYDEHGPGSFGMITESSRSLMPGEPYVFVLDTDLNIVAHGAYPERIGMSGDVILNDYTHQQLLDKLDYEGDQWVTYTHENPDTGLDAKKHSYLILHDNYIFGAGYYE